MHRLLCAALALAGSTSLDASGIPDQPAAGATEGNQRCTSERVSHRFVRGSDDFDTAMDFLAANAAFPSDRARIVLPQTPAAIEVEIDLPTACDNEASAPPPKACAATDCGDTPFAPADFAPGTELAMQTCAEGMHTELRWLAGSRGWQLLRAAQELVPRCESAG